MEVNPFSAFCGEVVSHDLELPGVQRFQKHSVFPLPSHPQPDTADLKLARRMTLSEGTTHSLPACLAQNTTREPTLKIIKRKETHREMACFQMDKERQSNGLIDLFSNIGEKTEPCDLSQMRALEVEEQLPITSR